MLGNGCTLPFTNSESVPIPILDRLGPDEKKIVTKCLNLYF